MTREWRRKPLKSLKMDSDPPACGGGQENWSGEFRRSAPGRQRVRDEEAVHDARPECSGPAVTQRLERGHQRAGSEYNLEGELRRGNLFLFESTATH